MGAETVYAILVGLFIGLVLGLLKTWLLWYRGSPFKPQDPGNEPGIHGITSRSLISYFLNIIILGLVYLVSLFLPLPLLPLLLTAATALIACGLIFPLQNIFRK
ncbi:MAG: hypothetical protein FWF85_01250 [Clostridiales bacterium]|jgi:small-conductance mechanosensitive channel|nr:hypothetical protein [Clostridiales bacterium]MDR2713484.1 hypothetical protein [Clostridiales bacterium]